MDTRESYDDTSNEGVSPVVGATLMVAITVLLAALVLFFLGGLDNPEFSSAGVTASQVDGGADIEFQLVDRGQADTVVVRCGANEAELTDAGTTATLNNSCSEVLILGESNGDQQVISSRDVDELPVTDANTAPAPSTPSSAWSESTYVSAYEFVTKLNESGDEQWSYYHEEFSSDEYNATECYGNSYFFGCAWMDHDEGPGGDVYSVTHEPGELVRLDGDTGSQVWKQDFSAAISGGYTPLSSVVVVDDTVWSGMSGGYILGTNRSTGSYEGALLFEDGSDGTDTFVEAMNRAPNGDVVIITRHNIMGGDANATVFRYDPSSGSDVFTHYYNDTEQNGGMDVQVGHSGDIYAIYEEKIQRLDGSSGAVQWEYAVPGEQLYEGDIEDETLYVRGESSVFTVDAETGTLQNNDDWPYSENSAPFEGGCVVTTEDGAIITSDDNEVTQHAPNGTVNWGYTTTEPAGEISYATCTIDE